MVIPSDASSLIKNRRHSGFSPGARFDPAGGGRRLCGAVVLRLERRDDGRRVERGLRPACAGDPDERAGRVFAAGAGRSGRGRSRRRPAVQRARRAAPRPRRVAGAGAGLSGRRLYVGDARLFRPAIRRKRGRAEGKSFGWRAPAERPWKARSATSARPTPRPPKAAQPRR